MSIKPTLCPECDGPMVSRKNSQTGQRFWGCKDFPKCRGTRNTDGEARGESERDDYGLPSDRWRERDRGRW